MAADQILGIKRRLEHHQVSFCIVGEIALNYYNVPRVVHDIEILVATAQAQTALESLTNFNKADKHAYQLCPWSEGECNVYTQHKNAFDRVKCFGHSSTGSTGSDSDSDTNSEFEAGPCLTVSIIPLSSLFPTTAITIDELIIPSTAHLLDRPRVDPHYSSHIIWSIAAAIIPSLPLPRLTPLMVAYASHFVNSGYASYEYAMLAEGLVDGMDIDEEWCTKMLQSHQGVVDVFLGAETNAKSSEDSDGDEGWEAHRKDDMQAIAAFVRRLVSSKAHRLDYIYPEGPSCFVHSAAEAKDVRRIPGRDR